MVDRPTLPIVNLHERLLCPVAGGAPGKSVGGDGRLPRPLGAECVCFPEEVQVSVLKVMLTQTYMLLYLAVKGPAGASHFGGRVALAGPLAGLQRLLRGLLVDLAVLQVQQPRDVDAGLGHRRHECRDAGGDDAGGLRAGGARAHGQRAAGSTSSGQAVTDVLTFSSVMSVAL